MSSQEAAQFLSLRMARDDAALIEQLRAKLGGSKSDIVKQALRLMAQHTELESARQVPSLFDLGTDRFGRYGDATRQSADIKSVVRQRLQSKRQASV